MDDVIFIRMYSFHLEKGLQVIGALIRLEGNPCNYTRLLKLIYLADRASLEETGAPIIGWDNVVMDQGPLHSELYDTIKGRRNKGEFGKYFERVGVNLRMIADPGDGWMCDYDLQKIQEVSEKYRDVDHWDIIKFLHTLDEVRRNEPRKRSSKRLPFVDAIRAVGKGPYLNRILKDMRSEKKIKELLGK